MMVWLLLLLFSTMLAGAYPFAGRECARALALMSTELSDCSDDLEGLSATETDNLREWRGRFDIKYPIIAKIVAQSAS